MFCSKCGSEVSNDVKFCPKCGNMLLDNSNAQTSSATNDMSKKNSYVKYRGFWSTGRLTIGIVSIVLFVLIAFQSCAVGLGNTLMENGASSGSQGMITALSYMIAGIVGIATRNSVSKGGAVTTAIIYWIGALFTIGSKDTYADLPIWGTLAVIFGLVFMVSAIKTTGEINER